AERPASALVRLSLRLGLEAAYPVAAEWAADARADAAERAGFIRLLGELSRPASLPALLERLGEGEPVPVRAAALLALQRYETPKVAAAIVGHYPKMTPALRDRARDVLVGRSSWSGEVLAAVTAGNVPAKDFSLDQVRRLFLHGDAVTRERA